MSSPEVMELTKECLQALRLGSRSGTPVSGNERLEVQSDAIDSIKILDSEADRNSPVDDDGNKQQSENTRHILATLKALLDFLPLRGGPKEVYGTKGGKIVKNAPACSPELLQQRKEFCRTGYLAILNQLVNSFDSPWFETLNKKQRKRFVDPFFLEGIPSYVLLLFCDRLKNLPQGVRLYRLMSMLEKFFTSDNYRNIFFQHAFNDHPAIDADVLQSVSEKILVALTSFPNIAANKLKEQTPKYLSLKSYYTFVVLQLTLCISEVMLEKEYSQKPLPPSVPVFLGSVVGKLCFSSGGLGEQILVQLLSSNGLTCLDYHDWKLLFNNIFANVPDTCLEATLLPLLRHCAHPVGVTCILGDEFLAKKTKAIFLLTNKYLFVKHFPDPTILQNIFGFLSASTVKQPEMREKVFVDTISKLLDVWGSEASISHTSVDQHAYLTKAIICGMAQLNAEDARQNGEAFLGKLLAGMSSHLSSPTVMVRELGMIMAEIVVDLLRTDSQISRDETVADKLMFEHAANEEVASLTESLRKLGNPPEMPTIRIGEKVVPTSIFPKWDSGMNSCIKNMPADIGDLTREELMEAVKNIELTDESTERLPASINFQRLNDAKSGSSFPSSPDEELDSDDDLEPYDIPSEIPGPTEVSSKAPKYIQECMEGLLDSQGDKDPSSNRMEICLKNCAKLIREAQADTMDEVGVEMARVLLHLADQFGAYNYNFVELRLKALIACVVRAPKKVATYLTGEFYERNYSIRQRMDILEVLSNGAQELANLTSSCDGPAPLKNINNNVENPASKAEEANSNPDSEHWTAVVQRRIDAKTKVISRGKTKGELEEVANRFGPVAGYFFFPLLKMLDRPTATLYLLDKDYLLLGRLLYCLGVTLYSAMNTPICRQMAGSLLEVVWCIRYHSQTYVRLSLIYAISIIVIAVPPAVLVSDFQTELLDTKSWLEELRFKDPEPEVQRQANQTLSLLVAALGHGMQAAH